MATEEVYHTRLGKVKINQAGMYIYMFDIYYSVVIIFLDGNEISKFQEHKKARSASS